jgi:hypothetical protein
MGKGSPQPATAAKPLSANLAARRNELVAALADDVFVAHATPGGRLETSLRQSALTLHPMNLAVERAPTH